MFSLISQREQLQLQKEAEEINSRRGETQEHAIGIVAQETSSDDAARALFDEVRSTNPIHIQNLFMLAHPEFKNTDANVAKLIKGLPEGKTLNTADSDDLEQAFAVTASHLQLEDLDSLEQAELYERLEQAANQQAERDRLDFERNRVVFQFFVRHPEFDYTNPTNNSIIDRWAVEHGFTSNTLTAGVLDRAYNELKQHLRLKAAEESLDSLYDLPMADLAERSGGFDNGHGGVSPQEDYVPSPSSFGSAGYTFEPSR